MGSRAGQVMKGGTLACAGNANFMAGYMMYGGRIIILGDSGEKVGEDMTGGHIFVGGRVQDLGSDAEQVDLDEGEDDDIRAFLDRYELRFTGTFKKIANAGKKLRYATSERQMRSIPFFTFSGASEYWNPKIQEDIYIKSQIGRYRIRGYGGARPLPHLADLGFRRDVSRAGKDADPVSRVALKTEIGGLNGANPLKLSMPVMIAPMSYGALSASTKRAVGLASTLSGIAENTGEGGMSDAQRGAASQLIFQMLGGRLGWNIHDMNRADGLEIYISQGAKPGLGGQLMAKKVTPELARIRGIPHGIDLRSPSRHPDILGGDDLLIKVEEMREATGYRLPVSVKLGAGRVSDDVKIAVKDGFDFIELDGMQGSTGAGSAEVIDYVGVPTLPAIIEAIDALGGHRAAPGHRDRADGRDSGWRRRGQGAVPGGGCGGVRHLGDHRGRMHRLHAVPHRAVRDRHRDAGPRARESLRPGSGVAQHPSVPRGGCAGRSRRSPTHWGTATSAR